MLAHICEAYFKMIHNQTKNDILTFGRADGSWTKESILI